MKPFIDAHCHRYKGNFCILNLDSNLFPKGEYLTSRGIHPWTLKVDFENLKTNLIESMDKIDFIGECGLDKLRGDDILTQMEVFKFQLKLAEKFNKGVILHCVKSYNEILKVLDGYNLKAVLFHGFNSSIQMAKLILEKNYYISIGPDFFKKNNACQFLKEFINSNLLFETDTKDLEIEEVYFMASKILCIEIDQLSEIVYSTFSRLVNK
ncbi:MAG: TatD family hydrolase [Candidatus Delongbacteria bacterium]|nr:TatD family hydrolase [Candidatus Delongbacteria bacterium]MBN2836554.1 TatD family hydrolase [Candidatus Delongbacteria bacterium]